jgi:hypothetical protein
VQVKETERLGDDDDVDLEAPVTLVVEHAGAISDSRSHTCID